MLTIVKDNLRKTFDFRGREKRKSFWVFFGFFYVFFFLIRILQVLLLGSFSDKFKYVESSIQLFLNLLVLLLYISFISSNVRRIRDAGKSGWFVLIPIYGFYLLFKGTHQEILPITAVDKVRRFCANCGTAWALDAVFCGDCGVQHS